MLILRHFGLWSLRTFKKERNNQGPKCLNHSGTWGLSVHQMRYRHSSPSMTTTVVWDPYRWRSLQPIVPNTSRHIAQRWEDASPTFSVVKWLY